MKKSAYHTPELTMAVVDCAALLTTASGVSGQLEGDGDMIGWGDLGDDCPPLPGRPHQAASTWAAPAARPGEPLQQERKSR